MPGLVPGIHVLSGIPQDKAWMAGTSPAMTEIGVFLAENDAHKQKLPGVVHGRFP
jgi:hypothetical protein